MTRDASGGTRSALGRWFALWAVLVLVTVVIGGITRLTESGLSITEWNPVSGVLPPLSDAAWEKAFAKYRQTPEYREITTGMDLASFQRIFWIEWIHRFWARVVGLAIALPGLFYLVRRHTEGFVKRRLAALLVLMAIQGFMGWYMVQSGLSDRTDVSQYRLAAHLGVALVIFGIAVWTAADLLTIRRSSRARFAARWRRWAAALVVLVGLTAMAGAFVAGLNAGRAYNTFPLMGGRILPLGYFHFDPWWTNLFEHVTAVQFNHRVLGLLTTGVAVSVGWMTRRAGGAVRWWGTAVAGIALVQLGLGIATLLLFVPIPLAALHQAGAVVLLACALLLLHGLTPAPAASPIRPPPASSRHTVAPPAPGSSDPRKSSPHRSGRSR